MLHAWTYPSAYPDPGCPNVCVAACHASPCASLPEQRNKTSTPCKSILVLGSQSYGGFHKWGCPSYHPFRTMGFSITIHNLGYLHWWKPPYDCDPYDPIPCHGTCFFRRSSCIFRCWYSMAKELACGHRATADTRRALVPKRTPNLMLKGSLLLQKCLSHHSWICQSMSRQGILVKMGQNVEDGGRGNATCCNSICCCCHWWSRPQKSGGGLQLLSTSGHSVHHLKSSEDRVSHSAPAAW